MRKLTILLLGVGGNVSQGILKAIRAYDFTKENVKKVLANNDGFTDRTYHKEENFESFYILLENENQLLMKYL